MPTSITTAPVLTICGVIAGHAGRDDQDVGAERECARSGVLRCGRWQPSRPSASASGRSACRRYCSRRPPHILARDVDVGRVRAVSCTPYGVQGEKPGAGDQSADVVEMEAVHVLVGADRSSTSRSICGGSGSCTRMPWTCGSAFSAAIFASSSASGGRRRQLDHSEWSPPRRKPSPCSARTPAGGILADEDDCQPGAKPRAPRGRRPAAFQIRRRTLAAIPTPSISCAVTTPPSMPWDCHAHESLSIARGTAEAARDCGGERGSSRPGRYLRTCTQRVAAALLEKIAGRRPARNGPPAGAHSRATACRARYRSPQGTASVRKAFSSAMLQVRAVRRLGRQLLADVGQSPPIMCTPFSSRIAADHADGVEGAAVQRLGVGNDGRHRHVDEDVVQRACPYSRCSRSAARFARSNRFRRRSCCPWRRRPRPVRRPSGSP